ncbi:MAG: C_GCAxxG_C_C family protein [Deltaproteobacteria bacterium]|nr:C_GCAxxG_C_C family protein [Deltaproteobacteria bacterium]
MTTKCDLAKKRFTEGFHCSQVILEAFAEDYGLDPILARRIGNPLAGGSGLGGECGAVTGALMVLGMEYGMADSDDLEAFQTTFEKVGSFVDKFKARHGNLNCHQLIGLNVFSEEGLKEFMAKDIKLTQCIKYVEDAVGIVEEIINQDQESE